MENEKTRETVERIMNKPVFLSWWLKLLIGLAAGCLASGLAAVVPGLGLVMTLCMALPLLLGLTVYGSADSLGLAAFVLVYGGAVFYAGGPVAAVCALLCVVVPLAVMIWLELAQKPAFYDRLFASLAAMLLGMVAALGFLSLIYPGDLADRAGALLLNSFNQLGEAEKQAISGLFKQMYAVLGLDIGSDAQTIFTNVVDLFKESLKISLPSIMLTLSVLNVFPGVLLCAFLRTKRHLPGASYKPVSQWRMPARYTIGLLVLLLVGIILNFTGMSGAVVLNTVLGAVSLACLVQYLASITDRLSRMPSGRGGKIVFFIAITLLMATAIPIYGAFSLLFGTQGLVTGWLRARRDKDQDTEL